MIAVLLLIFWGFIFFIKQPILFVEDKIIGENEFSSAEVLEQHVKELSSHERFSEIWLEKASLYILKALKEVWINENNIKIQKYSVWEREYHNIIVHFSKFWERKDVEKRLVVWAHHDGHWLLPWADDNASGVAWLLEIARILKSELILAKDIDLVFYSTEEMPNFSRDTMWSYVHAKSMYKDETVDVELMISLEMIWYFSDEKWSQSFPVDAMKYLYSDTGNYIAFVSNFSNFWSVRKVKKLFSSYLQDDANIWIDSINAPSLLVPQISFSDHSSYWKFWIPALMITDTAFLRNKNYHTPEDTYEKLDYGRMKEVVDATVYSILHLDE